MSQAEVEYERQKEQVRAMPSGTPQQAAQLASCQRLLESQARIVAACKKAVMASHQAVTAAAAKALDNIAPV